MRIREIAVSLLIVRSCFSLSYDTCKVIPSAGLSVIKYYRDKCTHCQKISPKISHVINSIEKTGETVVGMNIDVEKCNIDHTDITAIPTVVLQKNGIEILRFSGDRPHAEIVEMVASATGISRSAFDKMPTNRKEILKLTKDDFSSGFSGPWVIYFEDSYDKTIESILLQTYSVFGGDIKIAKYVGADKEIVASRYYIYDFPSILIMYDGILMRYNGEMTLSAFHSFCERLIAPSFREVTSEDLKNITAPTFVVFYSDPVLANRTFRRIAHDLKMNATTHKMQVPAPENETLLRLAVFKNGTKFYYEGDISDEGSIREWLFHSHFPNISKLSMDNFYSIFHGLKPVAAIVTDNGNNKELNMFEDIALEHNRGTSSSQYVFTFIDKKEYPKFTETNFGILHSKPLVVFFDPEKQTFYGERMKSRESFNEYFDREMNSFEAKTLPRYKKASLVSYKWLFCGIGAVSGIGIAARYIFATKKKMITE